MNARYRLMNKTKRKLRVTLWLSDWLSAALARRTREGETVSKTVERVFRELEAAEEREKSCPDA